MALLILVGVIFGIDAQLLLVKKKSFFKIQELPKIIRLGYVGQSANQEIFIFGFFDFHFFSFPFKSLQLF